MQSIVLTFVVAPVLSPERTHTHTHSVSTAFHFSVDTVFNMHCSHACALYENTKFIFKKHFAIIEKKLHTFTIFIGFSCSALLFPFLFLVSSALCRNIHTERTRNHVRDSSFHPIVCVQESSAITWGGLRFCCMNHSNVEFERENRTTLGIENRFGKNENVHARKEAQLKCSSQRKLRTKKAPQSRRCQ